MQTTGTVKVGAAFLAGVVVALGSAFVYFRAADKHTPEPVQVAAVEVPEKPADPAPAPPPQQQEQSAAETAAPVVVKAHAHSLRPKPRVSSRPVSLEVPDSKSTPVQEPITQQTMPEPPVDLPPQPASIAPTPVAAPQPHTVTIPAGTNIVVRMGEKLSTEHNYTGDTFRATLDAPIVMDGFIIADRGAKVLGRIVKAQKPGKLEGMAELSLMLTEVSTTDGQRVPIGTNESLRKGPSNTNEEVIKMAGGAALGAIIGALAGGGKGAAIGAGAGGAAGTGAVLLGRGKPAVIENETRLTFELANPITITEHLN